MRNEEGLTLVELLAVIVILSIIAIIAVVSISQVMKNARADTHLSNARNVLEVAKMAYAVGDEPKQEYEDDPTAKKYTLQDLSDMGYLSDTIKNPTFFAGWEANKSVYNMDESLVVVVDRSSPVIFKVNLSMGGKNYIFKESVESKQINRDQFTDTMKKELNIN